MQTEINTISKLKINKAHLIMFAILILACILRFYSYLDRIIVSQDQGRDAIIALESIRDHKFPLLGPPSSAWGFNFGALYYYVVILFSLMPVNFAPWIGFTCLSVYSVFLLYRIGEMAINKKFGYLLGFIGAISFSEVANSVNLLNTALVSFAVTLSLFAVQKLLNSNKIKFGLLLGFSVGLAINAHLQALSLLTLLPISLIFLKSKRKTRFIVGLSELIGLALSFLPLIVFEIQHNLAWTKSIIDYSLHVGEKFYVPIRWLTDITQFWPEIFGKVIFGVGNLGLIIIMLIIFGLLISFIKKKLPPKIILISLITFVFEIISVRYYKGPRSPEYLIVAQLFIILFFSWSIWQLLSINKIFGFATLLLLSIFILKNDLILLNSKSHSPELISLFNFTKDKYKDINLYLYDDSNEIGYSFLYLLQRNNLTGKSTDLAICDNHESIGLAERCPKENRIQESGRFVLYKFIPESKPSMFGIKELNASKVWNDIHINY